MIYCGLFTALIAAGAFIKIPVPVVPFTLQYLFTMLAGLFLGSRRGMISVVAYMLLGLAGLPIFSEGGGIWYIFKPSFGYIIGFCLGTYVTGLIAERLKQKTVFHYLLANLAGLMIVYAHVCSCSCNKYRFTHDSSTSFQSKVLFLTITIPEILWKRIILLCANI